MSLPKATRPAAAGTARVSERFPRRRGLGRHALFGCLLLFALPLVGVTEVWALNPALSLSQYNTRTWRRSEGLPSNAITSITQSADGYLWLGTSKGLVRFDGTEFQTIGLPGQDLARPRHVTDLTPRSAGGLWVAVERGGFGYYDGRLFERVQRPEFGGDFPTTRIVHEARDGATFAAFVGRAVRISANGRVQSLGTEADILCMYEDATGRVWLGTAAHGLQYWEQGRLYTVDGPAAALWEGYVISSLVVDGQGLIWVGASNGLHCLNPDLSPRPPSGVNEQSRAMLVDRHGTLWVGTLSGGLQRYRKGRFETLRSTDGLANNRVLSLFESKDGSLWVGTEDGLSQLSDVKFPIISNAEGLSGDSCLSVASARDGGVWAGTTNGLTHIRDGVCTSYGAGLADGFSSVWIKRVFVARNGDLYLLGGRREICLFRNGRVVRVWPVDNWPQSLAEDSEGMVAAIGARLYRLKDDSWIPLELSDGSCPQMAWINAVVGARDGSLWVASKSGVVQISKGRMRDFFQGHKPADNAFYNLCEDEAGAVWGMRDSGLVRFSKGTSAVVNHSNGLHSDLIHTMVSDGQGHLWMDSPEGIFRVSLADLNAVADGDVQRLHCVVFDGPHVVKASDKASSDFSSCRTSDGLLWFPRSKGVVCIDPSLLPEVAAAPRVFLNRVFADGLEYSVGGLCEIGPGPGNLQFDYGAVDFVAPESVRYRYRLSGYEQDWVFAGARRSAFYTNLAPGDYTFELEASSVDGVWGTSPVSVSLTLRPRLYQTIGFRVGLGVLIASVVGGLLVLRERLRRRQFDEVHRREMLLRQVIDSSPVAMALLEERRRVLYCNAAFTSTLGYTAGEIPDIEVWLGAVCPEAAQRVELLGKILGLGPRAGERLSQGDVHEAVLLRKDGVPRLLFFRNALVGDRTLVLFSDNTERRRSEEQRRKLEEHLRQAQKMEAIGQLSGGVAHDFNNLLTVIMGNVSMLESDPAATPESLESVAEIKDAAKRAGNLTRQLLAFSRRQAMKPVRLDLVQVVAEMARMLRRILPESISMELKLGEGPVDVKADAGMLEQVLLNLVVNARDAMPEGGSLSLSLEVLPRRADRPKPTAPDVSHDMVACLSLRDSGQGIPSEILPRIFEPFFTTKGVGKGTGLGLATAYGIIEQHSGWIDVSSDLGKGSVFRVCIPLFRPEGVVSQVAAPASASAAEVLPSRTYTILVVEDDPGVRVLARKTLVAHGHRVLEAGSGPEALRVWADHRDEIEVLFTDVVMPEGISGLELARRLLGDKIDLRVFYASGYSVEVAGGHFAGREGVDFLPKPYTPEELVRMITGRMIR